MVHFQIPAAALALALIAFPILGADAGSHSKTVIGYYASWQWYDRSGLAKPSNMDFSKVSRVNFAFFQVDSSGNIWGTDSWADPQVLYGPQNWNPAPGAAEQCSWTSPTGKSCSVHKTEEGLIGLAHAAGAQVYPSLGGWTLSDAFVPMAADPVSRAIFADKCVELIQDYDFDGIDLDWEVCIPSSVFFYYPLVSSLFTSPTKHNHIYTSNSILDTKTIQVPLKIQ